MWGGDVRMFHPPAGKFSGVIGGPPCQDFSSLRRLPPTGYGDKMLKEWARAVTEAAPDWFLMENVPGVPDVAVPGYQIQRLNLSASECGGRQRRNRCFQFGSRDATCISPRRRVTPAAAVTSPACLASGPSHLDRRGFADWCELQGLPRTFDLPGLSLGAKYRAVGNGVPVYMARVLARAVIDRIPVESVTLCLCGCGRRVTGRQFQATAGCRKRMERRRRDRAIAPPRCSVTDPSA